MHRRQVGAVAGAAEAARDQGAGPPRLRAAAAGPRRPAPQQLPQARHLRGRWPSRAIGSGGGSMTGWPSGWGAMPLTEAGGDLGGGEGAAAGPTAPAPARASDSATATSSRGPRRSSKRLASRPGGETLTRADPRPTVRTSRARPDRSTRQVGAQLRRSWNKLGAALCGVRDDQSTLDRLGQLLEDHPAVERSRCAPRPRRRDLHHDDARTLPQRRRRLVEAPQMVLVGVGVDRRGTARRAPPRPRRSSRSGVHGSRRRSLRRRRRRAGRRAAGTPRHGPRRRAARPSGPARRARPPARSRTTGRCGPRPRGGGSRSARRHPVRGTPRHGRAPPRPRRSPRARRRWRHWCRR